MRYPYRNEVHRATERQYGPFHHGYITRPMGHFIEQEEGGTGVSWRIGTPVQWYIDDIRGEEYPQVILPDGHMFTTADGDIKVITKENYDRRMALIHTFEKHRSPDRVA